VIFEKKNSEDQVEGILGVPSPDGDYRPLHSKSRGCHPEVMATTPKGSKTVISHHGGPSSLVTNLGIQILQEEQTRERIEGHIIIISIVRPWKIKVIVSRCK
jgi:hypothetical protein